MATDVKSPQPAPAGKYDAYIEAQLDKAQKRVRLLDLTAALLGLLTGTLAYIVVMVLFDRLFELSAGTRQLGLAVYLAGTIAYLALFILRPLRWRVNPYYAARQIEKDLPGAKNSVVNWIDLHEQKIPGVLRGAVGQRTAKDLANADVDHAISGRRTTYVGVAAAVLGVIFGAMFFIIGPRPFASFLGRTFAPFSIGGPPKSTWVELIRPKPGDTTITIGSPFTVVAEIGGKVPEATSPRAPQLLYRHAADEPWRDRFLQQDETTREWATTLPPLDVGNGFWYKVIAGDAETPEHRVTVRTTPALIDFQTTYHFRAYVGRIPKISRDRKLEALRGTEAEVLIGANRPIRDGALELEVTDGTQVSLRGERVPGDDRALRFRFVLDRAGKYRVRFTALDGEAYVDPTRFEFGVTPDGAPYVKLTEPGKNVELPADGVLKLKGEAADDIGVAALTLRMQVVGGPKLRAQPYGSPEKLRLPGGGNPRKVEYQAVVELAELRKADGQPASLSVGAEVEYWLEASDGCDYHKANVTESAPRYRVKLLAPAKSPEQKKENEAAREEQKKHEQKREEKIREEEQKRQQERQAQQERNNEEKRKGQENRKKGANGQKDREDKRPGEKEAKKEGGDSEKGNTPKGESKEEAKKRKDTEERAKELKQDAEKAEKEKTKREQESEEKKKGEGKDGGEKSRPGEGKGTGEEKKAGPDGGADKKPAGEGRSGGKEAAAKGEKPGESKQQGKKGESEGASSARPDKPEGGKEGSPKGAGKEGAAKKDNPGKAREGEKKAEKKPDQGKGRSGERKGAGESKPGGKAPPDKQANPGEGKGAGEDLAKQEKQAAGKEGPGEAPKAQGKGGEGAGQPKETGKGKSNSPREDRAKHGKGRQGPGKEGAGQGKGSKNREPLAKKDIDELAKAVREAREKNSKKGEAKASEDEVKKYLEKLKERLEARDGKVREQAEKELDDLNKVLREAKESDPGKGRDQKAPKSGPPQGKIGECKECKQGEGGTPGTGKQKGKDGKAPPAGKGKSGPGKKKAPPKEGEADQPGKGREKPGPDPGLAGKGSRWPGDLGGKQPPLEGEKPGEHRASMLQLEKFKNIDKDILKARNISPEEWQKFLKDYEVLARRAEARARADEKVPRSTGGGGLRNMGGSVRPKGKGRSDDLNNTGRGKAPPGYRDAYAEFLRKLSSGE